MFHNRFSLRAAQANLIPYSWWDFKRLQNVINTFTTMRASLRSFWISFLRQTLLAGWHTHSKFFYSNRYESLKTHIFWSGIFWGVTLLFGNGDAGLVVTHITMGPRYLILHHTLPPNRGPSDRSQTGKWTEICSCLQANGFPSWADREKITESIPRMEKSSIVVVRRRRRRSRERTQNASKIWQSK